MIILIELCSSKLCYRITFRVDTLFCIIISHCRIDKCNINIACSNEKQNGSFQNIPRIIVRKSLQIKVTNKFLHSSPSFSIHWSESSQNIRIKLHIDEKTINCQGMRWTAQTVPLRVSKNCTRKTNRGRDRSIAAVSEAITVSLFYEENENRDQMWARKTLRTGVRYYDYTNPPSSSWFPTIRKSGASGNQDPHYRYEQFIEWHSSFLNACTCRTGHTWYVCQHIQYN